MSAHLFRVIVPVSDIDAAAKFYAHVLDLPGVRVSGGRRVVVKRGAASRPLNAVGGGRMAVESGGAVTIFGPSGACLDGCRCAG